MSTEFPSPDRYAAQSLLSEAFGHFRKNLDLLRTSHAPEVVHQARVGWRRFKSAQYFFKPVLWPDSIPDSKSLRPMLLALSRLRDLDVARFQTLPELSSAFVGESATHAREWRRLTLKFADADRRQRHAVRAMLEDPGVQSSLETITQWIGTLAVRTEFFMPHGSTVGHPHSWTRRRVHQIHKKLRQTKARANTPKSLHRTRILAKHLRYSIEMLREVLPRRRAEKWHLEASNLQSRIGRTRDLLRASTLAEQLQLSHDIAKHLQSIVHDRTQQE